MKEYHTYTPADKTHVTDDPTDDGTTLCGIAHGGDGVSDIATDDPGAVLPTYRVVCQRCRAAYVKRVMAHLRDEVDVTDLDEGDVIEYWAHDDPTNPQNSLCLRKEAVIVETPPFERDLGEETTTITDRYEVQQGSITYATAAPDRIWRVNHTPADDILDDSALEDALRGALSTAYGVDDDA